VIGLSREECELIFREYREKYVKREDGRISGEKQVFNLIQCCPEIIEAMLVCYEAYIKRERLL
jgi:hypothetical protein